MQTHSFGRPGLVSTLTPGGDGLGMLWGTTTFDEYLATVHAPVDAGIILPDFAPRYGNGKAEEVVGAAFNGRLPDGVRITSKCKSGQSAARPGGRHAAALYRAQSAPAPPCRASIGSFCTAMLPP